MEESLRSKLFITVEEYAELMRISKAYAYKILTAEDCPFNPVRLGDPSSKKSRIVIPTNSFFLWYDSLGVNISQEENE